jgi:type II secretory pathway pseudopilin PulG
MKNFIKKIIKEKTNRGFTVLETLVAVFILVLAITGPMVFAQSGLRTAFLARDQITAFFLAQDAIETIKNIRDDNALKGEDWLFRILPDECEANRTCLISVETLYNNFGALGGVGDVVIDKCPNELSCNVMKNDSVGRFGYTFSDEGVSNSRFTRNVFVTEIAPGELQIVVEVKWTSNVRVDSSRITVQENIFDWVPRPDEPNQD